jgi:16S rRNA (guanine966-N2)-methyltransferase
MRIIGGKLKGKKLFFINSTITRPIRDMVKEGIFNIITHSNLLNIELNKSDVLDLYSGIGSFGIECISREAKSVTFVEDNRNTLMTLKKNLKYLSLKSNVSLIPEKINIEKFENSKKFDIIFLDPPFADNDYLKNLSLIKKKKIFKNNHIIIIHRETNKIDELGETIKIILTKKYGRSKIIFGTFE